MSWLGWHWSQDLPVDVDWATSSLLELKSLSNCGCCPVPGKPREEGICLRSHRNWALRPLATVLSPSI